MCRVLYIVMFVVCFGRKNEVKTIWDDLWSRLGYGCAFRLFYSSRLVLCGGDGLYVYVQWIWYIAKIATPGQKDGDRNAPAVQQYSGYLRGGSVVPVFHIVVMDFPNGGWWSDGRLVCWYCGNVWHQAYSLDQFLSRNSTLRHTLAHACSALYVSFLWFGV